MNYLKKFVYKFIRFSGITTITKNFIQKDKVTIILFHEITSVDADKVFRYLDNNYNIIKLDDYLDFRKGKKESLPKRPMIITFDDGMYSNYQLLPILKKYEVPITIFLCAGIINTNRHYWDKLGQERSEVFRLKDLPNEKRLNELRQKGFAETKDYKYPQALTRKQIEEMKNCGLVNFQSHTLFHPVLPRCKDDVAQEEITRSKKILEETYNLNINTISYPHGQYSERDISYAKEAGYECGITVDYGFNTSETDLFRLKRVSVSDTNDIDELAVKASGVWASIKNMMYIQG